MKHCRECNAPLSAREEKKKNARCRPCLTRPPSAEKLNGLRPFGTPLEQAIAEELGKHTSFAGAARALGMEASLLRAHLRELELRAARRGWSPSHAMTHTVPEGFHVKGVSTYIDGNGEVRGQWVKSGSDPEHRMEALFSAVARIAEPFKGAADPIAAPECSGINHDLMVAYIMGDPHVGMFSWSPETGSDHDMKAAEHDLITAVDHLVSIAPPAQTALVVNLGDFFHTDTSSNRTMRSGAPLDVDTRYAKVLSVGIRIMRRIIDRALEKHERVKVVTEIGNHDDSSALMLSLCLASYYEREPRVDVDTSPAKFHWHRFGSNLIGVTHGDSVKASMLPGVMSVDCARDWGETEHRVFYTGHVHHDSARDYPGVTVETFRTLAPADAWHRSQGYRSAQDMKCDVWHCDYGRIARHTIGIQQVRAKQNNGE